MEGSVLDTKALFETHFVCWRLLGILPPEKYRILYWSYSFVTNVIITLAFPLHLLLGLFTSTSLYDVIQNLAISVTCATCTLKTIAIWSKFTKVGDIFEIVRRKDERLRTEEEIKYMKATVYPSIKQIILPFTIICICIGVITEVSVLFNGLHDGDWHLMYHAYFPFDPFATSRNYLVVHVYQFIGISYMILQNVVNDTFAASHLALLGGQVHLLGKRIAKIGHDPTKTKKENNEALLDCIQDHKDCLKYHRTLGDVISSYMFFQIFFAGINMCVTLVFSILFAEGVFAMTYYGLYFVSMVLEILPSCYYGQILEDELQDIAYALFSCNWVDQDVEFKKNLRIFAETAGRRVYVTAWLFRINNNSLLIAFKNAYSLFALIMKMR